jgi:hypothetical protein
MILLCKQIIVVKSRQVKIGCSLIESCNVGCGSKKGCFANEYDDDENEIYLHKICLPYVWEQKTPTERFSIALALSIRILEALGSNLDPDIG